MRALVTGGSGHVGANLVRMLLADDHRVRCLVRSDIEALEGLEVELVKGDITEPETLTGAMQEIDVVFHCAAFVAVEDADVDLMERINIEGTRNMCRAALAANITRFVHISSVHAFQMRPTKEELTEDRPLQHDAKAAPYDRTKAAAQIEVLMAVEQGLNAVILHPTGVLGPWDFKPSRMGQVLNDMARGKIPVVLNTGFNWVDVADVCRCALNAVESGKIGEAYLIPGRWASMRMLHRAVHAAGGHRPPLLTIPFIAAYLALPFAAIGSRITGRRPKFSRGSLHALAVQCRNIPGSKAKDQLGHDPRPLEETIAKTIKWQMEHDMLEDGER